MAEERYRAITPGRGAKKTKRQRADMGPRAGDKGGEEKGGLRERFPRGVPKTHSKKVRIECQLTRKTENTQGDVSRSTYGKKKKR